MATIAVFIALGGSAFAVSRISGTEIVNRSIPAVKVKRGTLTAKEVKSSVKALKVKDLVVSRARGGKRAAGADAGVSSASGGFSNVVTLSLGGSATLLQSGPFKLIIQCVENDRTGKPAVRLLAESEVDGAVVNGVASLNGGNLVQRLDKNERGYIVNGDDSNSLSGIATEVIMVSPDGDQMFAKMFWGQNSLGRDCFASAFALV